VYRRLFLLDRRIADPIADIALPAEAAVRRLAPGDAAAYAAFRPEQGRAVCVERWARGHWCYATWQGASIVSAIWVARGDVSIDYLEQRLRLEPGEVYSYDLFTAPAARGLGLTRASRPPHLRLLREEGHRRLLASVNPDNRRAQVVQDAIGFRRIALMGYVGLGPWRRDFCRPRPGAAAPRVERDR
jgi:GNAT superfamily N-acetyltransferase